MSEVDVDKDTEMESKSESSDSEEQMNGSILNGKATNSESDPIENCEMTTTTLSGLRSSVNELEARKLLNDYAINCETGEEAAIAFLCTELHHPIFTCFRELTKTDFKTILNSGKFKKQANNLEFGLICLGLIDYLAMAMDNPLYSENYKSLTKAVAPLATKIMAEFKILFHRWSMSDNEVIKKRFSTIISYLRGLAPKFVKTDEFNFTELIDALDSAAFPRMKLYSETDTEEPERPILTELKINPNIFDNSELLDFGNSDVVRPKSHIVCNKLPSPSFKPATTTVQKNPPPMNGKTKLRAPTSAKLTRVLVPPPEIVDIDDDSETPNSKKPRLELANLNVNITTKDKPKVNAFALLMNRSREIAQAAKLRRVGVP